MARPDGFKRTPPTFAIEGVDEFVEALRAAYPDVTKVEGGRGKRVTPTLAT
jgi:hypothetical protein